MAEEKEEQMERGETGQAVGGAVGGAVGESVGGAYGGPLGAMAGKYVGEKVGEKVGDAVEEKAKEESKKKGGGCSGGTGAQSVEDYSASDGQCHKSPKTPKFKLKIEENSVPENWWDKLPDFDPRVYDAIAMEQAAACVKYVFDGLPDMHELENMIEARGFRKICPRLKTNVPRTKIVKPREIKYETTIDTWVKDDATY